MCSCAFELLTLKSSSKNGWEVSKSLVAIQGMS
jgi:hypothetical protein